MDEVRFQIIHIVQGGYIPKRGAEWRVYYHRLELLSWCIKTELEGQRQGGLSHYGTPYRGCLWGKGLGCRFCTFFQTCSGRHLFSRQAGRSRCQEALQNGVCSATPGRRRPFLDWLCSNRRPTSSPSRTVLPRCQAPAWLQRVRLEKER